MRYRPLVSLLLLPLALQSAASADTIPLTVARLAGVEAISEPYRFAVELTGNPVPFESLLGREVSVALPLPGGKTRHFSGICSRVSQGSRAQTVEIVPKFWVLTKRVQSRMFQDLTVPEILARVLGEGGIVHRMQLVGDFPERACAVQYRESDFDFASRLMEEEGIFYFFTHSANGHEMVLGNSPQAHPDLASGATVKFLGPNKPGAGVRAWEKVQELRSGKMTLRDFSFHHPEDSFEVSALLQESVAAGRVTHQLRVESSEALEVYDYPGLYAGRFDGIDKPSREDIQDEAERTVAIRTQEEGAQALVVEGAGRLGQMISGHKFSLSGHADADGKYLLTRVQHSATLVPGKKSFEYDNTFTCIPDALPFRPRRLTPRPVMAGVQSAFVTGPAGAEIHTDDLGRIKVHFPWDRQGASDENSSCWIRVGALHAGLELGFQQVPAVGEEVLVAFEHGDPDRPVIVGSVYNPLHLPPPATPR